MTAVRLDERTDNVEENVIFTALVDRTESRTVSEDPLASSTWEEEAYNWLPPPWVILAMIVVGFNEFVLLLRNPIYLLVIFVTFLLGKAILVQIDIPVLFRNGIVAGLISLSTSFLPTRMNISAGLTAEGQDRSATTTQKQQQLASRSFRNQKRRSDSVSCSSSIAESSVSSISTETGLESEYSSPLIRNTRRTHLHELFFWLHFKNMGVATNSGIDSLPEDLLTNILLRLPVKSLLLCKSVCKEWHAIISSPHFINKHFNHDGNPTRLVFYCNGNEFLCTYSYFPDENTLERHEVPDNLLLWGEITYLRGPCNGIFCIYIKDKKFVLWNPATRRLRFIQCCPSHIFDEMGFGVDPLTNDFKIVLVEDQFGVSPSFAVYTSSSDSWKYLRQESIRNPNALFIDFSSVSNAYLNGFYYWIMDTGYGAHTILAFDIHNETFEEITMPEIAADGLCLRLLNDSLALFSYDPFNEDKLMEI